MKYFQLLLLALSLSITIQKQFLEDDLKTQTDPLGSLNPYPGFIYKNSTEITNQAKQFFTDSTPLFGQYFVGYIPIGVNEYYPNPQQGSESVYYYSLFTKYETTLNTSSTSVPLILWLQGGPGCSDWPGVTMEFGPFSNQYNSSASNKQLQYYLEANKYTWAQDAHLLFVDNPIGTGLSVMIPSNITMPNKTEETVANIRNFLITFFEIYPQLQNNPFYVMGESFGGHYVPAVTSNLIAYPLTNNNWQLNLQGMAIGDGWTDPMLQIGGYAAYYNSAGLISRMRQRLYTQVQGIAMEAILTEEYDLATTQFNIFTNGNPQPGQPTILTLSGGINNLNYKQYEGEMSSADYLTPWIQKNYQMLQIPQGVANNYQICNNDMYYAFSQNIPRSYADNVTLILNTFPIMLYQGQIDACILTPGALTWINNLQWSSIDSWRKAQKQNFTITNPDNSTSIVGSYKKSGNLTYVLVNQAGHMVPGDQPIAAQQMFRNYMGINGNSFQ